MRKTNKAVKKRFKITAKGKVIGSRAGRRHLAAAKRSKTTRSSRRAQIVDKTDMRRVTDNLPFHH